MGHFTGKRVRGDGFSLVEILAVMAIASILMAVILPSLHWAREKARRLECAANMHQIGMAIQYYRNDNGQYLPIRPPTTIQYWDHVAYMNVLGSNYFQSNWGVFACPSNRSQQGMANRTNGLGGRMDYEINNGFFGMHLRGTINGEMGGIQKPGLALFLYEWPDPETLGYSPVDAPHPDGGFNGLFVDGHIEWITLAQSQQARGGFAPYWKWGR